MAARVGLAAALALVAPAVAQEIIIGSDCDTEYECEYTSPDWMRAKYDLRPMCDASGLWVANDINNANTTFYFSVCGVAQVDCLPWHQYPVEYQRGVAVQFFGDPPPPGATCTDKYTGQATNCTRDCEVLGYGPPIITLYDPSNSNAGVNVTHYGIPSLPTDNYQCPFNPATGATIERHIRIAIKCDPSAGAGIVDYAREYSDCQYEVVMRSQYGCGCEPDCYGKNCGQDGCGGYCGGAQQYGACPLGTTCDADQTCCKPNCGSRNCGSDGCNGTCGTCGPNTQCHPKFQQCLPTNASPSPAAAPLPTAYVTTTTGGDKTAAFFGGIVSSGVVVLGFTYFLRVRRALNA